MLFLRLGNKVVGVRGLAVILVVAVLGIMASSLYAGFRVERAQERGFDALAGVIKDQEKKYEASMTAMRNDHAALRRAQDQGNCLQTFDFGERRTLREKYSPGSWAAWCPWLRESDRYTIGP